MVGRGTDEELASHASFIARRERHAAESIRSFHLDALSSAVALNVDLDTTLIVWAAAYDHLRQRLPATSTPHPTTL